MANVSALSAQLNRQQAECVCVIETPKNSRRKYKYDEASGLFKLAYVLPEGLNFPFDFGFIPSTLADDGDPLDVMVLADEPGCVGTLTDIRLIGVINAQQTEDGETEENDRLLAIPVHAHSHRNIMNVKELDRSIIEQIESFFLSYTKLQGKKFKVKGCSGPRHAVQLVEQTMQAFKKESE
jgi:inorganic pyrophosphatase